MVKPKTRHFCHAEHPCCLNAAVTGEDRTDLVDQHRVREPERLDAIGDLPDLFARVCGRSKNPSFELVRKLAHHYGVSIDVLTGSTDEPAPRDLQIERIHRELGELTDRDRDVVADMIRLLKEKNSPAAD